MLSDGFDDEQTRKARERQLVLLGALLASKELRKSLANCEGWDHRINGAMYDVMDESLATKNKASLQALLGDLGIREWTIEDGNPLRLIAEYVRLDGEIAGGLGTVAQEAERLFRLRNESLDVKREAVRRMRDAIQEASK